MTKKIVHLTDRQRCKGDTVREIRSILRGIDSGEITGVAFVIGRRNQTVKTYYDYDCPRRALGDASLLKDYIKTKSFKLT